MESSLKFDMLQVTRYYKLFFALSGILVIGSVFALSIWGLKLGIDFKGGSFLELKFHSPPDTESMADTLTGAGFLGVTARPTGESGVIIKTPSVSSPEERAKLLEILKTEFGEFEELRFDTIGPIIGQELRNEAFWQVGLVVLGILLYIAYAFRRVAKTGERQVSSWRMSVAAIIALFHDLLIVLGVFSVLGHFYHVEIDGLFITALLTVLGFSVHDTIVVFDRVRENIQKATGENFDETVNYSVNQTLTRSINTSMTVLLVLLSLALFGGGSIFYFVLALLVGITVGTYSSIYIASALLVVWNRLAS